MFYRKDGNSYSISDLKRDFPNVGFPQNALGNNSIRKEYGIEVVSPEDQDPSDIQPSSPENREGYIAEEGSPEFRDGQWHQTWNYREMTWAEKRKSEYGLIEDQIEFITENGLEAWQTKVAAIKAKYPKS